MLEEPKNIYGMAISQNDLPNILWSFQDNIPNITNAVWKRLLRVMLSKKFPIDTQKISTILTNIKRIETSNQNDNKKEEAKQIEVNKLTEQEILSLLIYNYNFPFWETHKKDWNNLNDLILYVPNVANIKDYPKQPNKSDFQSLEEYKKAYNQWEKENKRRNKQIEKTRRLECILTNWVIKNINNILEQLTWAWIQHIIERKFHPNILEMSKDEENILIDIINGVKCGKKYFILLNHETFANIPITIIKFMQVAYNLWIKNVNEYFTTMIGPLIATHKKQIALINSLSNILVTHPAGKEIPWAKNIKIYQQDKAKAQAENDFDSENSKWQIYFCAPSWTRDIVHYWDDWIPQIFIPDASWWSNKATWILLTRLHKKNPDIKFYTMSTDTTKLKKPNTKNWVSPNNNRWNKNANVSLKLQELNPKDLSTEYFISTILNGLNRSENSHATAIPADIFKFLKKFTKTPEYALTWQLPSRFFNSEWKLDLNIVRAEMNAQKN